MGIGRCDIERIADEIDRAKEPPVPSLRDGRGELGIGVMGLVIADIFQLADRPLIDARTQPLDLAMREVAGRETQHLVEPAPAAGDRAGVERVDVDGLVLVGEQVAQEGAEPGVA